MSEHFDPNKEFKNRSIGLMSAERGHLTHEENAIRTGQLHKDLKKTNHVVVPVKGGYVENFGKHNSHEVTENSFLVMHHSHGDDSGHLRDTLMHLGQKYNQDSVLHKPHNSNVAYFHGTNREGWPGLEKKARAGMFAMRTKENPFFTRMPSGEEFTFTESVSVKNLI